MKLLVSILTAMIVCTVILSACSWRKGREHHGGSYAIYADFAKDSNIRMKGGLNRRIFNTTEVEKGNDIKRQADGAVILEPGTYHITGFSMVTMQATMAPPVMQNNTNYPGYCLVYRKSMENSAFNNHLCVGTPSTALDMNPSLFDFIHTCTQKDTICVGHQSGEDLHNEVYFSVYTVDTISSPYHLFSQINIQKM